MLTSGFDQPAPTAEETSGGTTGSSLAALGAGVPVGLVSFAERMSGPEEPGSPAGPRPAESPIRKLRGRDLKPRRRRRTTTVVDEANIAALHAAGISRNKIITVMDLTKASVDAILRKPEVREFAGRVRRAIQVHQLATVHETMDGARDWLAETVQKRDSASFDRLTRGLAALEKVAASASGENQRQHVDTTLTVNPAISEEAKELVRILSGKSVLAG